VAQVVHGQGHKTSILAVRKSNFKVTQSWRYIWEAW